MKIEILLLHIGYKCFRFLTSEIDIRVMFFFGYLHATSAKGDFADRLKVNWCLACSHPFGTFGIMGAFEVGA